MTGVSGGRTGLTPFLALSRGVFWCGGFKLALVAGWHSCCLQWYVHFHSFCEYDNSCSCLVLMTFECDVSEIWHMDNNFTAVDKFAAARSADGLVPYASSLLRRVGISGPWALLRFEGSCPHIDSCTRCSYVRISAILSCTTRARVNACRRSTSTSGQSHFAATCLGGR